MEVDNPKLIPLYDFRHPKVSVGAAIKDSFLQVSPLQEALDKASREFGQYSHRLSNAGAAVFNAGLYRQPHAYFGCVNHYENSSGSLAEATGISEELECCNSKVKPMIETYKRLRFKATTVNSLMVFRSSSNLPDIIVVEWL